MTSLNFDAHARHDPQEPFVVKGYELHVFLSPDSTERTVTGDDVAFADVHPLLGQGVEQHEPDFVKTPADRAYEAKRMAARSGKARFVVAFDLNDGREPFKGFNQDEKKVITLPRHEVHVFYKKGGLDKIVRPADLVFLNNFSSQDDLHADREHSSQERAAMAEEMNAMLPRTKTHAMVFCTTPPARQVDDDFDYDLVASAVTKALGIRTIADELAEAVTEKLNPERGRFARAWAAWKRRGSSSGPL